MFKLSFTTMATPDQTAAEAFSLAREFGYDGVDIRLSPNCGELTEESTDGEIEKVRRAAQQEGVQIASLLCYNPAVTAEPDSADKMLKSLLRSLEIAQNLGAPLIRIFGGEPGAMPGEEHIAKTARVIRDALKARGGNVSIAIQNHSGGYGTEMSVRLAQAVDSPRFGVAFSPDHVLLMREDKDEMNKLVKPYVKEIYIADVDAKKENYAPVLPGLGDVPLVEAVRAIGPFDGYLMFKWEYIWHRDILPAREALPQFIKWVRDNF